MVVEGADRSSAGLAASSVAPPGSVRRSVTASMLGKAAEMVTLVLLATLVPRVLGPQDYGRFSVPLTIVTIGSLAMTLGGPTLMARYVPSVAPTERLALARAIGARLARGRASQLALIAAATAVAVLWGPARLSPVVAGSVVLALALNVAATLALQVPLGLGRTGPWSSRYPLQNSVLILAVLVLHPVMGEGGGVAAIVVAAVAAAAFGAVVLRPLLAVRVAPVPVPPGAIRFGVLQAAGAALVQFAQRGGVLAVALLTGSDTETGFAALAIGVTLGATYAVLQAFTVSLPHLAGREGAMPADTRVGDRAAGARWRRAPSGAARAGRAEAALRRLGAALLAVILPSAAAAILMLDTLVTGVFGEGYEGAVDAFGPALALVALAPLSALGVQAAALRLRPEVALAVGLASAVGFVVVAVVAVPAWGAAGATTAALAGGAAGAACSVWLLPGAARAPVAAASFGGAGLLLALAALT